jgi:hypothetical protein
MAPCRSPDTATEMRAACSVIVSLCVLLPGAAAASAAPQGEPPPRDKVKIDVEVTGDREAIADEQLKEQEQQRLLGVFPNFRVSYRPDAVPLNTRQKFELAWKSMTDPARFATVAVVSGVQHSRNDFAGFGRGFSGYGKRYLALYATSFTASMISTAALPALLRQDPRYFYKGNGTRTARAMYALSRAVVRKGDNGHSQPDYSRIIGSLASGAISTFYYPEENRRGTRLTLENAALVLAGGAAGNLFQEFLFKRLTPQANHAANGQRP